MSSTTIPSPCPDTDDAATLDAWAPELADDDVVVPQALLVRVDERLLAIPLDHVRGVMRTRRTVRLPGAPAWVAGLAAIGGSLVPVAWVTDRRTDDASPSASWWVLVERNGRRAVLAVDAVDGVHAVAENVGTLPERPAVRLHSQGAANRDGASVTADVLDVAAVFRELFEED